jgi:ribosomal protein L19
MIYFLSILIRKNLSSLLRRQKVLRHNLNFFIFNVGDVIALVFMKGSYYFLFEGLCLAKRRKNFLHPETSFIICNVLDGVVVEVCVSYYSQLSFMFKSINSKFKMVFSRRAKLHYLRHKLTKGSRSF